MEGIYLMVFVGLVYLAVRIIATAVTLITRR